MNTVRTNSNHDYYNEVSEMNNGQIESKQIDVNAEWDDVKKLIKNH